MASARANILIVEDHPSLGRSLLEALRRAGRNVRLCAKLAELGPALAGFLPGLVLLDLVLPDGDAFGVLPALRELRPAPLVIAMSGAAQQHDCFRLGQLGVHGFVPKPFGMAELEHEVQAAEQRLPDIVPQLKTWVGHRPVHDMERLVRSTMVSEALARSAGSRRGAAKLLSISRQLLQHMLRQ